MKANEALFIAKQKLKDQAINSHQIDSLILLCHILSLSKEQIVFNPNLKLDKQQLKKFFFLIKRRADKEPISHIINKREFFGLDFMVNSSVLDPRADSETLIEAALDIFTNRETPLNILELGVGSACLILTLLKNFHNSCGIGIDIDNQALQIAIKNSQLLDLENRVKFLQSNWFSALKGTKQQKFDLIISNPPYIATQEINFLQEEVKNYEPRIALDGGISGLDCYQQIAKNIADFLKDSAIVILEIGQNQEKLVQEIFEAANLKLVANKKDLSAITRCLIFKKQNL